MRKSVNKEFFQRNISDSFLLFQIVNSKNILNLFADFQHNFDNI